MKHRKELEYLLEHSPFFTDGEKQKMAAVIPLFTSDVMDDLKNSLIRQNLRYLQHKTTRNHE